MRLGILTLHSQTNYGGVLQAYALQEILKRLGHDVVVIDRWMDECNSTLRGITSSRSVVGWAKFLARASLGFGDLADYVRHLRTVKMLPTLLRLSHYSFHHWIDAPEQLDIDAIVVGSDQVWNPLIQGDELPYLLEGAPTIPAIAYAASFGTHTLPKKLTSRYRDGMAKFNAISVREKEGVDIVNSLGLSAAHVLDPTLLVQPSAWNRFIKESPKPSHRKLVCYLIQDPLGFVVNDMKHFAKQQDCDVEIFFGGPCQLMPSSIIALAKISTGAVRSLLAGRVHTHFTATPNEFLDEISHADWVLTDSFHALMFSAIFKRNVRVLKPRNGRGTSDFVRLEEFVNKLASPKVLCSDYSEAFASFVTDAPSLFDESRINEQRSFSMKWLKDALSQVQPTNRTFRKEV